MNPQKRTSLGPMGKPYTLNPKERSCVRTSRLGLYGYTGLEMSYGFAELVVFKQECFGAILNSTYRESTWTVKVYCCYLFRPLNPNC